MTLKLFGRIIWETFQWVALFGGLVGLLTGLALILNQPLVVRLSQTMNVWISTRQAMRPLEQSIEIERSVYRSHRIIGTLLVAGALFTLYVLLVRFSGPEVVNAFVKLLGLKVATWAAESLRIFLVIVNFAALVISAVMVVRPSGLKRLESWANRQYSAREATRPIEVPRAGPDVLMHSHPRALGIALAVAGLYVLFLLGYARFAWH